MTDIYQPGQDGRTPQSTAGYGQQNSEYQGAGENIKQHMSSTQYGQGEFRQNPNQAFQQNGAERMEEGMAGEQSGGYGSNMVNQQNGRYEQTGQNMEHGINGQQNGAYSTAPQQYGDYRQNGSQQVEQNMGGQQQYAGYQQTGVQGQAGQHGAKYPNSKAPDALHVWLDKIEKKFGGERFNNPDNDEKNAALNENIIKKLKQVMQIVIQRGPSMAMQYGSKLF